MVSFPRHDDAEPQSLESDAFNSIFNHVIDLGPKLASKWGLQEGDLSIARAIGEAGVKVGAGFCVAGVEHTSDELSLLVEHAMLMVHGFILQRACEESDGGDAGLS